MQRNPGLWMVTALQRSDHSIQIFFRHHLETIQMISCNIRLDINHPINNHPMLPLPSVIFLHSFGKLSISRLLMMICL